MASIYKVIRDNDIHLLNYMIDASVGDQHNKTYNDIPKEFIQAIQQQMKRSGSKYYDLNKRSVNGRTALHCAAIWNRVEMAQALISCPSVNVNLKDRENGWTALHRALYMGNVEIARLLLTREDIELSIKDWEGFDAFELFNSTILDTFPKEQILQAEKKDDLALSSEQDEQWQTYNIQLTEDGARVGKGGTDVYSWGHNTNYVLGHADSENRLKPERVNLQLTSQQSPLFMTRPKCAIESISMSKYHMAILTSESQQNLLVCGFGRGGRLGTGRDSDTQFTPIPVQWPERIVSVALGRDHTVAVTVSGNVITFGQNNYGQLGYELENHNKEDIPMQLVPRKIQAQSLKKQPILGAAASRVHSVVFTSTDLFTFGLNQGQLGYHQPDNEPCQYIPRKVSMSTKILQVVANDNATAILNSSHEIILLCNYNQQKLFLPTQRFPNNVQVHRSEINFAVQLVGSGTEHLAAVTNAGDVFIWTCRSPHARQSEQTQQHAGRKSSQAGNTGARQTIISTPKRIWTARKAHLAAIDASIGQHGEIVICTLSGHVFIGRPENNGYKFNQISSIQRCIRVCANSSGAFAAIRSEYQLRPLSDVPASTLVQDMISSLPHIRASKWLETELKKIDTSEAIDMAKLTSKYQKYTNSTQIDEKDALDLNKERIFVKEKYDAVKSKCVHRAWSYSDSLAAEDSTLDIVLVVGDRELHCHSSVLRCRSEVFKRLIKCKDRLFDQDIKVRVSKRDKDNRIGLEIEHCQITSVLLLLDFIYSDQYQHPMSMRFEPPALSSLQDMMPSTLKTIQKDLLVLAKIFHIPNLIATAQENYFRKIPSIQEDLQTLLIKGSGTDVTLKTKEEDSTIKCHELILRQRCPFFGKLFDTGSVWVSNRRKNFSDEDDGHTTVNLEHIPKEILDIVIRYIYADEDGSSLFDNIAKEREESMMQFLINLLCEADYLLLNRLKAIVEDALIRFIKLKSAATIFECADIYLADTLKEKCLQFISVNLPAFLGTNLLQNTPVRLIRDLENYVRNCQIQETPTVPRGNFAIFADESFLEVEDPEFSTSIFASTRGDGSVSRYMETLVTLHSEKSSHKDQSNEGISAMKSKAVNIVSSDMRSPPPPVPKADSGRTRKGLKVSLDNIENELISLSSQQRRPSSGWASTSYDGNIEPLAKPSLREIIETENQPTDPLSKTAKPIAPKKVSQKERRKMLYKQELESVAESSSSSSKTVWGNIPAVDVQNISKELNKNSGTAKENPNEAKDRKGKKIYVPEELLDDIEEMNRSNPIPTKALDNFDYVGSLGPSFVITPIRRLHLDGANTLLKNEKKSFETIQKQQQLEDDWRKNFNPKKNIIKIQKEEQAIESIAQHYVKEMDIMSGEWFEVRRITTR